MKFIKISLALVAAVLLLFIISLAIFVATFDANDYRPQISEQVKQQTGRDFQVAEIRPSVFPWVGIELQQIALSNASGFEQPHMLKVQRLDVKIELLPLITQQIHIDTLQLHGLELYLQKNNQGQSNWDDIAQKQTTDSSTDTTQATPSEDTISPIDDEAHASPLAALMINGIDIKNANIHWNDQQQNQKLWLKAFNLSSGTFKSAQLLPLHLTTQVEISQPETKLDIDLKTSVNFDSDKQLLLIPEFLLNLTATGDTLPQKKVDLVLSNDSRIDLKQQQIDISKLTLETLGLELVANARIENFQQSPEVSGQLNLQSFSAQTLMQKLAIELPAMKNSQALNSISAQLDFSAHGTTAKINSINIKLDQSTLSGKAELSQTEKQNISYELNLDSITLSDYLPPASETETEAQATATTEKKPAQDTPINLPVELIRSLDVDGTFKISRLTYDTHQINNIVLQTRVNNGIAKLSQFNAALLDGTIDASASLDVNPSAPKYAFNTEIKDVKADSLVTPVLQDITGETDVSLNGSANLKIKVATQGNSVKQLTANSNGNASLNIGQAVLNGIDAEYFVRKAVVGYMESKNIPVSPSVHSEYQPKQATALKTAQATATIRNGVVNNKDLLLEASRFTITGAGQASLPAETIDYRLIVDLQPSSTKTTAEKLLDVPVPVKVKGKFSTPSIGIDNKAWLSSLTKAMTAEKTQEAKQKVEKKTEEKKQELKDKLLKKLFR